MTQGADGPESLRAAAVGILLTADAHAKAAAARACKARWDAGLINTTGEGPTMPERPARPPECRLTGNRRPPVS